MLARWRERLPAGAGTSAAAGFAKAPPVRSAGCLHRASRRVLLAALVIIVSGHHKLAPFWDFHVVLGGGQRRPARALAIPAARPVVLAHENSFVYPAPAALAMVPFALLPFTVSAWLFALLAIASIPASPCGSSAFATTAATASRCSPRRSRTRWRLGAISPILLVGRRARSGGTAIAPGSQPASLAAVVMLKLFLWPLMLWLAFTRRLRAALFAVG